MAKWKKETFISCTKENCEPRVQTTVMDLVKFAEQDADQVSWGRGEGYGTMTFKCKSDDYRQKVLGPLSAQRVSIEAGITTGWEHYTGLNGLNIGIDTFGESAPGNKVADHFGLIPEKAAERIRNHLKL